MPSSKLASVLHFSGAVLTDYLAGAVRQKCTADGLRYQVAMLRYGKKVATQVGSECHAEL